tara:strand:+ start:373 stop:612 length:240 start_codon:yes stop_codon:yes gene_type:complete
VYIKIDFTLKRNILRYRKIRVKEYKNVEGLVIERRKYIKSNFAISIVLSTLFSFFSKIYIKKQQRKNSIACAIKNLVVT